MSEQEQFQSVVNEMESLDKEALIMDMLAVMSIQQQRQVFDAVLNQYPLKLLDNVTSVASVDVTTAQMLDILSVINERILDEDDEPLTIENVKARPALLEYIVQEAAQDGVALYDPVEFWNDCGWCDIRDYM